MELEELLKEFIKEDTIAFTKIRDNDTGDIYFGITSSTEEEENKKYEIHTMLRLIEYIKRNINAKSKR